MTDRRCVIVFVKVPGRETVKSRLAREMGRDFVLRLYESMVLDTIDTLKTASMPFRIFFSPPDALEEAQHWLGREHAYMPQTGDGLGERMEQAFAGVFSEGADDAVLIGSDIPGLSAAILYDAFRALESHAAVIGPANDGGYYLIGFSRKTFHPAVFRDMLWSTESVCQETVLRLRKASLPVSLLRECADVDTREDLKELLALRDMGRLAASRTLRLIEQHRDSIMK
jgi:hypothetical protein